MLSNFALPGSPPPSTPPPVPPHVYSSKVPSKTPVDVRIALDMPERKERQSRQTGLLLRRFQMLRSLRHYLRAQSQGHHIIDCLEEKVVEKGSAGRSSLKGRERDIVNQTNIGTVSKAMLGKRLRDGVERIWDFFLFSFFLLFFERMGTILYLNALI